jgi:hypothetical protein
LLAEKNPKPFRVALDAIEQECWDRAGTLAVNQLRHGADFQIPVSAVDPLELSHRLHEFEPLPDIFVGSREITLGDRFGFLWD